MGLLAWLGKQKTRAVTALVLIGIFLPALGSYLKPFVTEAVFAVLIVAFLRIDFSAARSYVQKPGLVVAASAWTTLVVPLLFSIACWASDVGAVSPALFLALMLQAVTSPMMAAPAFAALMGLDATLVLLSFIVSSAVTPFSAPMFAALMGLELPLSPLSLGLKLFGVLTGSAFIGIGLRRLVGEAAVTRYRDELDGVNILVLFVFIAAVMGEVGLALLSRPMTVLMLTVLAFGVYAVILVVSYFAFIRTGRKNAFAIAMMTSQRNMGLMLAGTGGVVPDMTWLYIAVGQFPIYLSPQLLQPVARFVNKQET
ncbi:MAG: Na+-dependent transporter [Hyphomicrobiaceae bacterium]|nr:Na+-dependent transporter [Hyphomicrobiaceae bacterium]